MIRPDIMALCIISVPVMVLSDTDPQRAAAVDQMANACITDNTHPTHDSDLCVACIYGTYYQARFLHVIPAPGTTIPAGGQILVRVPNGIDRSLATAPDIWADGAETNMPDQRLETLPQELAPAASEMFIFPMPQGGANRNFDPGSIGQIVR